METPPRTLVERLEAAPSISAGSEEGFNGYGVMGLPFASGHVLAMRRFVASSIGPGYVSVWHRAPDGRWVIYATIPPERGCARYFGAGATRAIETEIRVTWEGPSRLRISVPQAQLEWDVSVGSTAATRMMNAAARLLPTAAWSSSAVLRPIGLIAGPFLGVGRIRLRGTVPNGQRITANPRVLWAVTDSRAVLAGEDLGRPGPVHPQAHLGDFWIPQRGMFAMGQTYFESFDPARHSSRTFLSDGETR